MHAMFDLTGQTALITGAGQAQGIGFATAKLLAQLGARVVLTATGAHVHERVAELNQLGLHATGHIIDLTDRVATTALAHQLGDLQILINNAGMTQQGDSEESAAFSALDPALWDKSIARNLTTCFNITHALVPHMLALGYGRIVNVSSVTGPLVSNPGEAAYSAAKAAMIGMSRSLALELASANITINNIAPGWIASGSQTPEEKSAALHTPGARAGTPLEVAFAIACLVAPGASYITGAMLVVDGGNCLQETKG